jgi:hypothetical protein
MRNIRAIRKITNNNNMGRVIIASDLIRTREMLDIDGNVIDPRTKQIIKKVERESILPPEDKKTE